MGFFTTSKPVITEKAKDRVLHEIHGGRDENGNHYFNTGEYNYVQDRLQGHMDSDAPKQLPGITREEETQVLDEMSKPSPEEQHVQRYFGVKHGFNKKQVGYLGGVLDKHLK